MLRLILIIAAIALSGCAKDGSNGSDGRSGVDGTPGIGTPGAPGQDGYSIVSKTPGTLPPTCTNGGAAVDLYLDLDRSLTYTVGDSYQSTLFACNGIDGQDGEDGQDGQDGADGEDGADGQDGQDGAQGPPGTPGSTGTMTFKTFFSTLACQKIMTGFSAQRPSTGAGNLEVYANETCAGGAIQTLNADGNDAYWPTTSTLLILNGTGSSTTLFIINFN